ncbi:MAG: hypothetical protein Ct9H300mP19_04530 [Dehalococcoidia bacterium]|nr:MAG: hypothetical protein Ct9H300mP19_04530 [Dehalococcoidia bacterium]
MQQIHWQLDVMRKDPINSPASCSVAFLARDRALAHSWVPNLGESGRCIGSTMVNLDSGEMPQ